MAPSRIEPATACGTGEPLRKAGARCHDPTADRGDREQPESGGRAEDLHDGAAEEDAAHDRHHHAEVLQRDRRHQPTRCGVTVGTIACMSGISIDGEMLVMKPMITASGTVMASVTTSTPDTPNVTAPKPNNNLGESSWRHAVGECAGPRAEEQRRQADHDAEDRGRRVPLGQFTDQPHEHEPTGAEADRRHDVGDQECPERPDTEQPAEAVVARVIRLTGGQGSGIVGGRHHVHRWPVDWWRSPSTRTGRGLQRRAQMSREPIASVGHHLDDAGCVPCRSPLR